MLTQITVTTTNWTELRSVYLSLYYFDFNSQQKLQLPTPLEFIGCLLSDPILLPKTDKHLL